MNSQLAQLFVQRSMKNLFIIKSIMLSIETNRAKSRGESSTTKIVFAVIFESVGRVASSHHFSYIHLMKTKKKSQLLLNVITETHCYWKTTRI